MQFHYTITEKSINADFIVEYLDRFSLQLTKYTMIILDNASVHKSKKMQERFGYWQQRGLYIFFLPPYSPQLNLIERLWKEIKKGWLRPCDYHDFDTLSYAVNRIFANVGKSVNLTFK